MSHIRIAVGGIWHESNGFSPCPTTTDDFRQRGDLSVGSELLNRGDRQDEVKGFLDVLRAQRGVEPVPLLRAGALPSGLLSKETADVLEGILRAQLREAGRLDGVCLALHGAMSGEAIEDMDGHLLRVCHEEIGPETPIVCSLDCHAIITRRMVETAAAIVAYRTHPHVDLVETGRRAANILMDVVHGRVKPVMRYRKIPVLVPPPDNGTRAGALKELFDTFIGWDEVEGVIACSLCCSFAWQDAAEQGWTALAVTNDDAALAETLADELAEKTWNAREGLLPEPMLAPEEALCQAAETPGHPVIITDSADTVGGGAPGDNSAMLSVLLEKASTVNGLVLIHLPDPEAVAAMRRARIGETVTVAVGGKRDTRYCRPVTLTGQVLCLAEGPIEDVGNFVPEPMVETGSLVCLGIGNIRLVLSEMCVMGPQPSLFRKVGLDPFDAKVVVLKTGVGYKPTYGRVAKRVIRADCPGAESYNLKNYEFTRIARPMFPLDGDFEWSAHKTAKQELDTA